MSLPPPKPIGQMLRDRYGQVVADDRVAEALVEGARLFLEAAKAVRDAERMMDELSEMGVGHEINRSDVRHQFNNIKRHLLYATPWCKCPQHQRRGCRWCKGHGWLSKGQYDVLPEEFKP